MPFRAAWSVPGGAEGRRRRWPYARPGGIRRRAGGREAPKSTDRVDGAYPDVAPMER
jgi:hypothetical protein